jgi:pyruvate dehydrogenase E1 component
VWSITSYTELRRDAQECERLNMLYPNEPPRVPYVAHALAGAEGPVIASSDYVRALPEQISPWVPGGLFALGTDGMGRSESRAALRRHFEVDAEFITLATLYQLKKQGKCDGQCVANAVKDLNIDPAKKSALYA